MERSEPSLVPEWLKGTPGGLLPASHPGSHEGTWIFHLFLSISWLYTADLLCHFFNIVEVWARWTFLSMTFLRLGISYQYILEQSWRSYLFFPFMCWMYSVYLFWTCLHTLEHSWFFVRCKTHVVTFLYVLESVVYYEILQNIFEYTWMYLNISFCEVLNLVESIIWHFYVKKHFLSFWTWLNVFQDSLSFLLAVHVKITKLFFFWSRWCKQHVF